MLELRPNSECCDKDLPPNSTEAWIYSSERTRCANCVETRLFDLCPNCGGGFEPRPIRPRLDHRSGYRLKNYPASNRRITQEISSEQRGAIASPLKQLPLNKR